MLYVALLRCRRGVIPAAAAGDAGEAEPAAGTQTLSQRRRTSSASLPSPGAREASSHPFPRSSGKAFCPAEVKHINIKANKQETQQYTTTKNDLSSRSRSRPPEKAVPPLRRLFSGQLVPIRGARPRVHKMVITQGQVPDSNVSAWKLAAMDQKTIHERSFARAPEVVK